MYIPLQRMSLAYTWQTLLLLTLVAGSYGLLRVSTEPEPKTPGGFEASPNYWLENSTSVAMNVNGQRQYRLRAAHTTHYLSDDTIRLQQPQLEWFSDEGETIYVAADSGLLSTPEQSLQMNGAVTLRLFDTAGGMMLELFTADVQAELQRSYLQTEQPVTLRQGNSTTRALGMYGDLEQRRLEFLRDVHTVMEHETIH